MLYKKKQKVEFLKINIVCAIRKKERICRYVKKKVYFIPIENLNRSVFTCVLRIEKITILTRYRLHKF